MKKFSFLDAAALIIWSLPVFYLFFNYAALAQVVPVHFGLNGDVDRYGSKTEFLTYQCIMLVVPALLYLLFKFLPLIDPKKKIKYGTDTFKKLGMGLIIFFTALNTALIFATIHQGFRVERLLFPLVGLLFAFIGNIMLSIKPNYFAGIRTPWTLESEDNWRATHRLAGRLWFAGGIVITILTLLISGQAGFIMFMSCVGILVLIPVVYSYLYFKKSRLNHHV
ncbi:MAG TPA: SdpI family protein [Mucilaginibacter sp.]|jgi:uncharacterized membrane protein|nr:SdpI family protein [Mucilaginibacter sp.]